MSQIINNQKQQQTNKKSNGRNLGVKFTNSTLERDTETTKSPSKKKNTFNYSASNLEKCENPNQIRNPETYRCVDKTKKTGQDIINRYSDLKEQNIAKTKTNTSTKSSLKQHEEEEQGKENESLCEQRTNEAKYCWVKDTKTNQNKQGCDSYCIENIEIWLYPLLSLSISSF